jgi:hypothetical protein
VNVVSISPIPDSPRPLGPEGLRFWQRMWAMPCGWINPVMDLEYVTILCEAMDERSMLRLRVLQNGDRLERVALRNLETQITTMLSCLGLNPTDRKAIAAPGGAEGAAATRLSQLRNRAKSRPS